jgi:hypothetical protein
MIESADSNNYPQFHAYLTQFLAEGQYAQNNSNYEGGLTAQVNSHCFFIGCIWFCFASRAQTYQELFSFDVAGTTGDDPRGDLIQASNGNVYDRWKYFPVPPA